MTEILCSGNVVTIRAPGGQETVLRLNSESGFLLH